MGSETHECPRCACQWSARNGAYRDEVIEWMQHYDATVTQHRGQVAELHAAMDILHDEAFMLRTRAVILEAEALLLRYDVAEALRRVPVEA